MDTKGQGEDITYPHICFKGKHFHEVFTHFFVHEWEMVCVELVANDKDGAVQGVIFLGSIRYDFPERSTPACSGMGAAAVAALPGTTFASAALVVAAPHLVQASSTPSSPGLLLPGSPPSGPPFPASYPLLGRVIADRVTPGPAFSSRSLPPLPKPGLPARPRSPSMRATSTSPTVGATDALPSRSCRPPGRRPTCGISHACCLSYRGHSPCWGGGVGVRGCGGGVDGVRVGRGGVGSGASAGVIRGGVGGGDWVAVIRGGIGGGGCRGDGVNGNGGCGGESSSRMKGIL
ncbi:GD19403 [Drosophila simulans]|uniref:GD19403 n=1 Tax=Drosophila simulans TaxID=7240 RepID=B4NVI1_DROSI|nr:GD19403 [Drosophila simulans]